MRPSKYASLRELETTATAEFERLLRTDPYLLPKLNGRYEEVLNEVCDELGVPADLEIGAEFNHYNCIDSPLGHTAATWGSDDPRVLDLNEQQKAAACLRSLLKFAGGNPSEIEALTVGQIVYLNKNFLYLWWVALVVPELHAEGVTAFQSGHRRRPNDSGGGSTNQEPARFFLDRQKRKGVPRNTAKDQLLRRYTFSNDRANQLLREVYGPVRKRRVKKSS